ncbi:GvpL/GvpF family gas vesicle protein [Alloyangia mangrovi]|nr:GvpL/GvpF family gas vesicle protein [Alloyangia mangrovi]
MSVLHLHGLVPAGQPAAGAPLHRRFRIGPMTAIVTEGARTTMQDAALDSVLAHDRLLSCYLASGPVLPVRFGTCFSGPRALQEALAERLAPCTARLEALRGHAEYALTVEPGDAVQSINAAPNPETGREFLKLRKIRRDRRLKASEAQSQALRALFLRAEDLAAEAEPRPARPPRRSELALLMTPATAAQLRQTLPGWCADHGLIARLAGPFPPYSFAHVAMEVPADV